MQVKNNPPKYVKLKNTAMRLESEKEQYWRDAGLWGVEFRFDDIEQKWYSVCKYHDTDWLDNVELIPITKEEWKKDNEGYV